MNQARAHGARMPWTPLRCRGGAHGLGIERGTQGTNLMAAACCTEGHREEFGSREKG